MKRDPNIAKLIKESGTVAAPEDFTASVMDKIAAVPVKKSYKPLIGRWGRIIIIVFILAVIITALFYTDTSGELFGRGIDLPALKQEVPQFKLNLDFLDQVNFSAGVAAGLLALFILILSDAGLSSRRRFSE
jgi:hypothetical protein